MTFGQALREARERLMLRQRDVALKAGISPQYYCDLENDRRGPPPDHVLFGLQYALSLALDYLFYVAGRLPIDICGKQVSEQWAASCFEMMRQHEEGGHA